MLGLSDSFAHEQIDVTNPVDWSHPLNQGRLAWWLCTDTPGWRGGNTLRDLARGAGRKPHDAALGGLTPPTWRGNSGRIGGRGSLRYSASNAAIGPNTSIFPSGTVAGTLACWFIADSVSVDGRLVSFGQGANSVFALAVGRTSGKASGFARGAGFTLVELLAGPIVAGVWYHLAITMSGTTATLYLNGVAMATTGSVNVANTFGTMDGSFAYIGAGPGGTGASSAFSGTMDDVSAWNRALSKQEVPALYALSKQGYPGLLNRLSSLEYSLPGSGGGGSFQPAWACRASGAILGGR